MLSQAYVSPFCERSIPTSWGFLPRCCTIMVPEPGMADQELKKALDIFAVNRTKREAMRE